MMKLRHGRPETNEGRLQKEIEIYDFLDSIGISYDRVDHPPADTMEVCRDKNAVLGATICKNLFLTPRTKSAYYLLMMPAEKPFRTSELSHQIGSSRLSFASAEDMESMINVTPGSASVMALYFDREHKVTLVIDEDILKGEYFGCHPAINTSSLKIKTSDLTEKLIPAFGNDYKIVTL